MHILLFLLPQKLISSYSFFSLSNSSNPNPKLIQNDTSSSSAMLHYFFCGNFGIILLNSNWLNKDGGKKALDMLEKMIEVTMMRGKYTIYIHNVYGLYIYTDCIYMIWSYRSMYMYMWMMIDCLLMTN